MGLLEETQQSYYAGTNYGNYQFTSLTDIINQFMVVYVGEDKIIRNANRTDVAFHAQRALAELSFDTLKSCKAQETTVSASLQMILPQDYVNYTKVSWVDSAGIKHLLYPTSKTSNPTKPQQDSNGDFLHNNGRFLFPLIDDVVVPTFTPGNGNLIPSGNLITNGNFHGGSDGWVLNTTLNAFFNTDPLSSFGEISVVTDDLVTLGDPVTGYFYGYNGNAIGAYAVPANWSIFQDNVSIVSGEEYKITYTLSGYTSGSWDFHIVDKNGDATATTSRTANGTYTETITASGSNSNYPANSIFFRNNADAFGNVVIDNISIVRVGNEETSTTWSSYKSGTPSENQDDYQDDTYWPMEGSRYGLDPQYAQANGSFYIDCVSGKIHFSSNIAGKTVILDYISDSLGTDGEMQVHKFAEEAMYKWMSHAILAGKANIPEYQVNRLKKERFAAIRTAKLRLSNLKLEELTQILRGKSKQIKH
mgnify:CR=1 FL=1